MMTVVTITQINLRPVQEFTGDRMKQAQRVNSSVRTGFAQSIEQVRSVAYRTVLASVGLGGLAFDGARRKAVDGWELLDKAEERGEEIEQMVMTGVSDQVHRLETQAGNELRKLRVQLPSVPAVPSIPAVPGSQIISDQLDKPLDWTVRRFTIQRQANGAVHAPLTDYDELTAQQVIDLLGQMDASGLEKARAYEAKGKARVTVLRAIDTELAKKLSVA